MAELPHCSIVVPTYDRPAALRSCLESLAGLEYARERYEVIVVDDGGRSTLDPVVDLLRPRMNLELVTQARSGPAAITAAVISVLTAPGAIAFTWTFQPATSLASDSVNWTTAAFEAAYALMRGVIDGPPIPAPARLMIRPDP